ncbi:uncharacterized protein BCR38DRAFT_372382 [Pseudomassariella vexata]|uniref:HECT-type E3 ubiquitin transferase n=1 Tax=Pseudomassariella vexata TaxID=1141098 RepID=A0A1Y2DT94_9PEZI|nr:uncharacterized protein BCR38DRAFT_372382 [Pseudomassariella vexata]ORY62493.1 hypothetical protein BCR38DRAFT_372382 [Pseudomassariella vexata]
MYHTFSGNSRRPRNVNLSGQNTNPWANSGWTPAPSGASQTVANAQAEREKRQRERNELVAAQRIQRVWRGHRERRQTKQRHRQEWDLMNGLDDMSDPDTAKKALALLLAMFDPSNPADQSRLDHFVLSLAGATSALAETPQWNNLAPLLVIALERRPIGSSPHLLDLLVAVIKRCPSSATPILGRLYKLLSKYGQQSANDGSDTHLAEVVTAPLADRNPEAYEAFALYFLTSSNLSFLESSPDQVTRFLELQALSQGIIYLFSQQDRIKKTSKDDLLWLLAHFIALNRALPTSRGSAHLEALYLQLSMLAPDIHMRFVSQVDGDEDSSDDESEDLYFSNASPLPPYVTAQLEFLVDEDGISELLSRFTSTAIATARMSDDASLLAGYTLILLKCFPTHGDDIKMHLFQGDIATDRFDATTLPAVKYFWEAASRTEIFTALSQTHTQHNVSLVRDLVKSGPTLDHQWRIILLFVELYNFLLRVTDDEDFLPSENHITSEQSPAVTRIRSSGLALHELRQLANFLKNLTFPLYYNLPVIMPSSRPTGLKGLMGVLSSSKSHLDKAVQKLQVPSFAGIIGMDALSLRALATATMRSLYDRDSRRPYLSKDFWLMTSKFEMDGFISAVILEEQKKDEAEDEDVELLDPDVYGTNPYHTSAGQRLSRAAQIEKQRHLRRVQREQLLAQVGPKLEILRNMPFAIPFDVRVQIFRQFVHLDKMKRRGGNVDPDRWRLSVMNNGDAFGGPSARGQDILSRHSARIKRGQVFSDAFNQFYNLGEGLKEPIQITFIDQFDQQEAGIDGGGVTKEFLTSIIDEAFYTSHRLFTANSQNLLYPNPTAFDEIKEMAISRNCAEGSPDYLKVLQDLGKNYEFLGRIVGKCMYEGILIDVAFANFFLQKWSSSGISSSTESKANLYDLRELDPELYKGLVSLKNYTGDVADLSLDFAVTDQYVHPITKQVKTITRPLRKDGENIPVTNKDRPLYIAAVVHYRLVQQLIRQNRAFLRGLGSMINPSWLSMFNPLELQRLVGGDSSEIDIDDLRRHTEYSGVYTIGDDGLEHPTVQLFWQVMHSLKDEERRDVLKYVTSTPRAPLLGFAQLSPAFSIRDSGDDEERLPSTSTCVNLLKLPRYSTAPRLKEKLLYAIQSGAGFDLS